MPLLKAVLSGNAGLVFVLVFAWKILLLVFAALPPPSNDSFFYDGAVVNLLLHGKYCNPSLANALPISGTQVFSAYPPLYQLALLPWMGVFGTSVQSAMTFHLVLFGAYTIVLYAIFRQLNVTGWAAAVGGLFLFGITFHDRPDSLTHVFGLTSLYAWVRWEKGLIAGSGGRGWAWAAAIAAVLAPCTSIQIGGLYCVVFLLATVIRHVRNGMPLPWPQLAFFVLVPICLVGLVVFGFPLLWAGFLEHARQTPSLTGLRIPRPDEILKLVRNVPGILAVSVLWMLWRGSHSREDSPPRRLLNELTMACLAGALFILGAAMVVLTPNSVSFTAYLQPLIVAGFLAIRFGTATEKGGERTQAIDSATSRSRFCSPACYGLIFVLAAALTAIRAVGLSTWGLACALDCGHRKSIWLAQSNMADAAGDTVVLSSAYLYAAAPSKSVRWVHCDWIGPAVREQETGDWSALLNLRPTRLMLTQFDYYRRFQPLLEKLSARPDLAQVEFVNSARLPTPDSIPALRRVLQHISWAPVIVTIRWSAAGAE